MGGLTAEASSDPLEGAIGVIVLQDTRQLEHVLFFADGIHHFTHVVTRFEVPWHRGESAAGLPSGLQ
jgi:hypothetical protein